MPLFLNRQCDGTLGWHPATDGLRGTDAYPASGARAAGPLAAMTFSTPFGERWTKLLMASGDRTLFAALSRPQLAAGCASHRRLCH